MSEGDRAFLSGQQELAVDDEGQEILVGLTREESEWYLRDSDSWMQQRMSGKRAKEDKQRYVELSERHEVARLKAIALMNAKPAGSA